VMVIIVLLGSLPGKIAASRNHPYATAISAAAWISFLRSPDENNLPANREEGIRQELENRD